MMGTYQLDEDQWGQCSHETRGQRQTLHHASSAVQRHASPAQPCVHQRYADGSKYLLESLSNQESCCYILNSRKCHSLKYHRGKVGAWHDQRVSYLKFWILVTYLISEFTTSSRPAGGEYWSDIIPSPSVKKGISGITAFNLSKVKWAK